MKSLMIENLMRDWQEARSPVNTARTNATNVAPVQVICEELGAIHISKLSLRRIEKFRNLLLERGLSKVTVARYLSVLRAGLGEGGEIFKIGKLISELNRGPNKVECWTKKEAVAILDKASQNASDSLWIYIKLLFATGMRRGEALSLHWEDFDLDRNRIHIHRSLALDGSVQSGTKWGGERYFPVGEKHVEIYEVLEGTFGVGDGVIFHLLDQRSVGRNFNRIVGFADVPQHKMHCTRHSAISWALASGMSLRKASEIFGVSQGTLEKHYAHYVEEEVSMEWANL
jgi:integrase